MAAADGHAYDSDKIDWRYLQAITERLQRMVRRRIEAMGPGDVKGRRGTDGPDEPAGN